MARTLDLDAMAREGATLDVPALRAYLDALDVGDVTALLQAPGLVTKVHATPTMHPDRDWTPGDGRPSLADDDPAVMAAIARCAVARWRSDRTYGDLARTASHPEPCGWCPYPPAELDRALRWSEHHARLIVSETYIWRRGGSSYRRDTDRAGQYENPAWATFAAYPAKEQRYLVDRAVEASRANLADDAPPIVVPSDPAPTREHLPWCDLRPDHAGECPAPPDDPEDAT